MKQITPQQKVEFLNIRIEDTNLWTAVKKSLIANDIHLIKDLATYDISKLLQIKPFGKKGLTQVQELIKDCGLDFEMSKQDILDLQLCKGIVVAPDYEYGEFYVMINSNKVYIRITIEGYIGIECIQTIELAIEDIKKFCTIFNRIPLKGETFWFKTPHLKNEECMEYLFYLEEYPNYSIDKGNMQVFLCFNCN